MTTSPRTWRIVIPGTPKAKGRPRFTVRGGFARTYTPAETLTHENFIRSCALDVFQGVEPIDGPIALSAVFYLARPKSHFGSGRNAGVLKDSAPAYPTGKPDTDNVLKAVMDGLTLAKVWTDDARVVRCQAEKSYGSERTEIIVEEIG